MNQTNRNILLFSLLLFSLVVLFFFDLLFGSIQIPFLDVIQSFSHSNSEHIHYEIVQNIRLPKAITAILVGAALSVAGLMMQTLFRNPLADPYILGVSSGASLGVAVGIMLSSAIPFLVVSAWNTVLSAILGATIVMLMVLFISYKVRNSVTLLIVGIMLGTITASIVNIIQYFSNPDVIKLFVVWSMGSLGSVTWEHLTIITPLILVGIGVSIVLQKKMNALLLGENYAVGLGVNISRTRFLIVLITSVLAGAVTAFTGPIAFIGIAVPHMVRGIFRTANHEILIPASLLVGANLLLVCDILSQIPTYPLPINTISALFGAPIIIWIILKRR